MTARSVITRHEKLTREALSLAEAELGGDFEGDAHRTRKADDLLAGLRTAVARWHAR
jgi:hypothetical protein